ncbi:MAG: ADOP family duplicated permease [Gemmatimonadaceae bacterium]
MREFLARIVDWFRRDALERELAEELQFHRTRLEQEAIANGTSPADVRHVARRRFGSEMRVTESTRDRWSIAALDVVQHDARYALRGLIRAPAFSLTIVATLALGIGANAAMFSIVDRLWFRPVDLIRNEATVSRVYQQWVADGQLVTASSMPYQRHVDVRDRTTVFSDVAGYSEFPVGVGEGDAARERPIAAVSASFFRFFDAQPVAGRFIVESDDTPPVGAAVAVLTYDFWQSEFGRRNVVGEMLQVGDVRAEIIGIAPRGLGGLDDFRPPAVFIPAATLGRARGLSASAVASFYRYHPWNSVVTLVRRKPGVSIEAAEAEVTRVMHASWDTERVSRQIGMFRDAQSKSAADARLRAPLGGVRRAAGPDRPPEMQSLFWISGVAFLVLVIACANVLNLMLARALKRQREIAMRVALGVSRGRLLMQAVTEGTILALVSGAAGLVVAHWGAAAIRALFIDDAQAVAGVATDIRTLLVVFGLSLLVGLVTGLAQLFLAQKGDLATTLRAGGKAVGAPRARFRTALLVLQGALSVVLLVGAALFIGSLRAAQSVPKGYDLAQVLVVSPVFRSGTAGNDARAAHQSLIESTRALPGVAHASLVSGAPLWRTGRWPIFVPGIDSVSRLGEFTANAVSSDYFAVMGTRIVRGRPIMAADNAAAAPVAVVSRGMAEALWPGQDAIGRCMRVGADTMPCTTVVGVAENIMQSNYQLGAPKLYHYYLAVDQIPPTGPRFLLVNVAGAPAIETERVRKALQGEMPGSSFVTVRTMESLLDGTYRTWRLGASMFLCFGLLALIVAAVGLYGLIGYEVTQRMHELGVRVALGARRQDIIGLVVGRTIRLTIAGIVLGGSAAFVAARWLEPLLFRQSSTDARVYGLVGAMMLLVAVLASAVPALRASQADPNRSLRSD